MPRPSKCRRVCAAPRCTRFEPQNAASAQPVELQVDEFEALRLMDYEGLTQEECARRKVVTALVEGRALHIRGGAFSVCEGGGGCGCGHCWRGGNDGFPPRG